jgi:hypothetical protein
MNADDAPVAQIEDKQPGIAVASDEGEPRGIVEQKPVVVNACRRQGHAFDNCVGRRLRQRHPARVRDRSIFGHILERTVNCGVGRYPHRPISANEIPSCTNERLSVIDEWRVEATNCLSHKPVAIDTPKATEFCNENWRIKSSFRGG